MMYCGVGLAVITAKLLILEALTWTAAKHQPVELVIQTKPSVLTVFLACGILTLPAHFLLLVWCNKIIDGKEKRKILIIIFFFKKLYRHSSLSKYDPSMLLFTKVFRQIYNSIWMIIHTSHEMLLKTHSLIYKNRKKCLTPLKNLKSEFLV